MPAHWTYEDVGPSDDLAQGDILEPTSDLSDVLLKIHPHFADPKYIAFLVVTQTCDLVRHRESCGAPYLTIAAVKSIREVLPSLLHNACGTGTAGVFRQERKNEALKLVMRLINQNEQALGLFYLHADNDAGVGESAVALLRVAISLWSEHYAVLVQSRRGRLQAPFRNKLGWLVGNLYSRVGTRDWEKGEADHLVRDLLSSLNVDWIDGASFDAARRKQVPLAGLAGDELVAALKEHAPSPPLQVALDRLKALAEKDGLISSEAVRKLTNRLSNDATFKGAIKTQAP